MNCKICYSNFDLHQPNKLPRVLIKCGHTFCDQCINQNLKQSKQIVCQQCGKISELIEAQNFPLNQTLIGILKENKQKQNNETKQQQICKIHGRKLQAFCESDTVILCLQCVLSDHKSHKVVSIDEKVIKQKQKLQSCFQSILKSQQQLQKNSQQCQSLIDKLNLDLNQYIFQINLTYKNIVSQLKEIQQSFINQTKKTIQKSIQIAYSTQNQLKDKQNFYKQLKSIHQNLILKSGVNFLSQLNTCLFITENSTLKQNFSLPYKKISLQKDKLLNQFINSLQQLLNFEKKKNSTNLNKSITNDLNNSATQSYVNKNLNKTKSKSKNESLMKSIEESPCRLQKKNLSSIQRISKQPQILEVNLVQKYERHQQAKNMKKKNSDIQNQNITRNKSTKIEYEVKRQVKNEQSNTMKLQGNKTNNLNKQKQLLDLQSSGKFSKINQSSERRLSTSKFSSCNPGDITTSFFNETYLISSPDNRKYEPFQNQTPLSIKSFMQSSQFTINQQKTIIKDENFIMKNEPFVLRNVQSPQKDETVLKDSRSQFSIFDFQQKILHFGGLRNNTITCSRINPSLNGQIKIQTQIMNKGLSRSKSQCVILRSYSTRKCLILGGKDENGERTKSIMEYDIVTKMVNKSSLQLTDPISGFGAVVNQNKLYVFGGSSFTALKTLQQYRYVNNTLEVKRLSSMINSRDQLGFALGYDGYLYVAGGINSSNMILNSCERYCFKTNKWTAISAMKTPRRSFSLVSLPNGIYAIGGHDGRQYLRSVQMYDFDRQQWVDINPMNNARFTHTAISTSDYQYIIVFGGYQSLPLKSIQIYNITQNKWQLIQQQQQHQRYLHCSILINNNHY